MIEYVVFLKVNLVNVFLISCHPFPTRFSLSRARARSMGACAFFSGFSDQIIKPHFRPTTLLLNAFMESLVNSYLNYFNFDKIYCVYMCFAAAAAAALSLLLLALLFKCTLMHTNGI